MRNLKRFFLLLIAGMLLAACDAMHESPDYDRHTLSQLSQPLDGSPWYWFDVTFTPEMPEESELAEAKRMEWLAAWLAQRKFCPNGYEIVERRPFEFLEHNPAQHDMRYKVQCS